MGGIGETCKTRNIKRGGKILGELLAIYLQRSKYSSCFSKAYIILTIEAVFDAKPQ